MFAARDDWVVAVSTLWNESLRGGVMTRGVGYARAVTRPTTRPSIGAASARGSSEGDGAVRQTHTDQNKQQQTDRSMAHSCVGASATHCAARGVEYLRWHSPQHAQDCGGH
jgi:hypothetical protein